MKIAITYENGQIFQHFGHTKQFKIYTVEDGKILSSQIVDTNGSGHGALASFLKEMQADVIICGGIGGGAQTALANAGIKLYGGVVGLCDEAATLFVEGKLQFNPNVKCNHHSHEAGHNCTSHGCGTHKCN
ncbi:MAG: dinitrogenase iron-molybdenum cofactor biosynthesis protein [Ruminococcaceae bacterium]|nr:dinitrogenase iron-molybdenum cofactor biosynthesis protein [Oscillospiraceae bacterium]